MKTFGSHTNQSPQDTYNNNNTHKVTFMFTFTFTLTVTVLEVREFTHCVCVSNFVNCPSTTVQPFPFQSEKEEREKEL